MDTTPRLWSWMLSPFAAKARIAFAHKGVDVELIEIDARDRHPRLAELNPANRVPVLEVGGHAIRESSVICEWLDETHPEPAFWPSDPSERAAARGVMRWIDDEITLNFFRSMRAEAFGKDPIDPDDIVDVLRGRLAKRWAVLEHYLGRNDGPWLFGGDEPLLPDLSGIAISVRLPAWKPELVPDAGEYPLVTAWLAALRAHPTAPQLDIQGKPQAEV